MCGVSRLIIAVLVVAGMVAGCGTAPAQVANQADSFFAQRMILHGKQAAEAAGLVAGRTTTPAVLDLARRFQDGPAAESGQLSAWVKAWGEVPHVSDASVAGAIRPADLARLRDTSDQRFDSAWLNVMIVHHRGAITMAETELRQGARPEARAFAQQVVDTRQAELDVMQGMSGG
jgi:uncharacterized protein (DUF305 family)